MELTSVALKDVPKESLAVLLTDYRYGRYCEDNQLSLARAQAYEQQRIQRRLAQEDAIAFYAKSEQGEPVALLVGHYSSWDADHFGYGVAVIDYILATGTDYRLAVDAVSALLGMFHDWCHGKHIRFISVRLSALQLTAIHALEGSGYRYIESYISNVFDLRKLKDIFEELPSVRLATLDDLDLMLQHARGAFAVQRFHADPHISNSKAETLYSKWIRSAFRDPKRETLVFEKDGVPAAWAVCLPQDLRRLLGIRSVTTQVLLVAPEARGSGFGLRFMHALFKHYGSAGVDVIDSGVTMRNVASVNWHNRLKFRVVSTQATFHKWMEA